MENSDFLSSVPPLIRRHLVPLGLTLVGVILIAFSLWSLALPAGRQVFSPKGQGNDVVFEQGAGHEASVAAATTIVEDKIQVDVAGAVVNPGVYALPSKARVKDAITMAGGFSDKANAEWIAKNLNLAAKLSDATKIYVPFEGEDITTSTTGNTSSVLSSGVVSGQAGNTGLININTASQSQLEGLSGVGPVTAQKVIANRPYSSVDDLLTKKVVGQSVFGKIREQVAVN